MGYFILNTQSTCNMYLLYHKYYTLLHQWCFCYILFHDIIKWILWIYDPSQKSRIDAHWLLTPVPVSSYPISMCRNCHCSCCKWCLLMNCVLVLLLFDSVYSLDLLQSYLCDWKALEASGSNWIKIFWQLFVTCCPCVFSQIPPQKMHQSDQ